MKVNKTTDKDQRFRGSTGINESRVHAVENSTFQAFLNRVERRTFTENIEVLLEDILVQGEKLSKKTDIKELQVYKKLISQFLGAAVGGSHEFLKQNFLDRRGRHRVYAVVKKINTELQHLTEEVLKSEKDHIKILEKLDIIKGLILDLEL